MSKYLSFNDIVFKDRRLLLSALADLGYSQIEEGDTLPLFGYRGDRRSETAQIVIRRQHVGPLSNDIGFAHAKDGYRPIVSEFDQRTLRDGHFLVQLRTAYSERVVEEVKRRLHGTAQRQVEGGVVKIRVRF
ncbi:MAG TPA: hypothetical protein VFB58_04790 [Chloroflexota bacterium]|nr:hypothetical protein [Chloroflexota bacterium]